MNQTIDILCRARELYASAPSHAPLGRRVPAGENCVVTAISAVALDDTAYRMSYRALREAMAAMAFVSGNNIARWNAEHSTEEVLAAFDRAIAAQRLVVPPLQRAERREPVRAGQGS